LEDLPDKVFRYFSGVSLSCDPGRYERWDFWQAQVYHQWRHFTLHVVLKSTRTEIYIKKNKLTGKAKKNIETHHNNPQIMEGTHTTHISIHKTNVA
jgi:hypothetical protein